MADRRQLSARFGLFASKAPGILVGMLLVLSACQASPPSASYGSLVPLAQPSWLMPAGAMGLATTAGLVAEPREYLVTHIHAHLDLFVDGKRVTVPAGIGIDIAAAGVRDEVTSDGSSHSYFVDTCQAPCLSPVHTHDPSGTIHEESRTANHAPYSLGQLFTEWGVRLNVSCVGEYCKPAAAIHVYIDGNAYPGDPASIQLPSHREIAIVIGQPPALIPATWDFAGAP
jgi:hypothetical protein